MAGTAPAGESAHGLSLGYQEASSVGTAVGEASGVP